MADRVPGFEQRTVIDVELEAVGRLAHHAARLRIRRPAVLIDSALAGSVERRLRQLVAIEQLDRTPPGEPSISSIAAVADRWSACGADGVVAVGGGSTLDTAKVARAMVAEGRRDIELPERFASPLLPLIAVPTTAGTGAELGSGAIVFDPEADDKVLVKRRELAPDVAICDGALTVGLPPHLTATTGADALAQAVLAYVAARADSIAGQNAVAAIRLLLDHLPDAVADGSDLHYRGRVMLGSVVSALAMFNAPPTFAAEHLFAERLAPAFGFAHGHAVAALLAPTAELNLEDATVRRRYAELGRAVGASPAESDDDTAAGAFVVMLRDLTLTMNIRPLDRPDAHALRATVDRCCAAGAFDSNPRPVDRDDVLGLLEAAFDGTFRLDDRVTGLAATNL